MIKAWHGTLLRNSIDLEYMCAVLSRGMHHIMFWLSLSARVSWERHKNLICTLVRTNFPNPEVSDFIYVALTASWFEKLGSSRYRNPKVSGSNCYITASFFGSNFIPLIPLLGGLLFQTFFCCLLVVLRKLGSLVQLSPISLWDCVILVTSLSWVW
jgi:hypothetical protein